MKSKMTRAAGLAAAFVAGMVVATAWGGGMVAARAKRQGQQIAVEKVMRPTVTDEDIALLRKDIRAMKMQVIGQNMSLSDEEAQKFWPIYKHYADDLHEVHNEKYALFKQYAEMWATMTDQDALVYVRRSMEADAEAQALRLEYVPVMNQILPGKKAATFFQLERRLCLMVDLQLYSQIPLANDPQVPVSREIGNIGISGHLSDFPVDQELTWHPTPLTAKHLLSFALVACPCCD
jgi:hypothetical protein